ncbi:MAG: N-6 DNA methylase, partial [Bacteroidetes bacterium]|nr:N-6 DNA methylase [Bacteroidota bacterium]
MYLRTDKGERKATGSYYTPDYIVQYIVENTIGELINKRIQEAKKQNKSENEAILKLKILDPAMGSGHFLVGATEFMAEELVEAINRDIKNG